MSRETLLLLLLKHMGYINGRIQLQKLMFLLEKNYKIPTGYYFIPYKFGPYSDAIQEDLQKLVNYGYVRHALVKKANNETLHRYQLTEYGEQFLLEQDIPEVIEEVISDLCHDFKNYSLPRLISYVYEHYPEYTINSEIREQFLNPKPPEKGFISADKILKERPILQPSFINWLDEEIEKTARKLGVTEINKKKTKSKESQTDELVVEMLYIAYEDILEKTQDVSTQLLLEDFSEAGDINNKLYFITDILEKLLNCFEEEDVICVYTEFANTKTNLRMLDELIEKYRTSLQSKLVRMLFEFIDDVNFLLEAIDQLLSV